MNWKFPNLDLISSELSKDHWGLFISKENGEVDNYKLFIHIENILYWYQIENYSNSGQLQHVFSLSFEETSDYKAKIDDNTEEISWIEEYMKTNITEISYFNSLVYIWTDINTIVCVDWEILQENIKPTSTKFKIHIGGENWENGLSFFNQSPLIYSYKVRSLSLIV